MYLDTRLLVTVAFVFAQKASAWTVGQVVDTTSVAVSGHEASDTSGVSEYLGIPYAQAPVGQLRFAPPVAASRSSETRNASTIVSCPANSLYGPDGLAEPAFPYLDQVNFTENGFYLQNLIGNFGGFHYDEDCLQLNVWTKPQSGEAQKAVLLFFYGGGFNFGSSEDPRYTGKYLADTQDIVVVTINYRMNIFGFPGAPNTRQNLGLLDQRLAVEWVRDNIANFAGDPSRITLFGQSAGGGAQDYYAQAWTEDPIVAGFIPQSGTNVGRAPGTENADPWFNATETLGCGNADSNQDEVLACMRNQGFTAILAAIQGTPGLDSITASVQFSVVADGITAFTDGDERFRTGNYIKVPILIGNTDNEAGVAQTVIHALTSQPAPQPLLDLVNLAAFECGVGRRAMFSATNGVPTYRYRWFGHWANMDLGLGRDASTAYHEAELSTMFGSSQMFGIPNTAAQQAIQDFTMDVWASFAKDPENGLAQLGWPLYTTRNPQMARLAFEDRAGVNAASAQLNDAECIGVNLLTELQAILLLFGVDTGFP